MKSATLATITLVAAFVTLPACNDSSPVEAKAASATGPVFSTSAGGPAFQTKVHDDFASYFGSIWDDDTDRYVSVWVSRAGPGRDADATLSFSGGECKQTGPEWWDVECTYFSGWGIVPANHVTGTFGGGLAVHTDLRDNPNFMLWGADPGVVSVRWRRTGLYESRHSGSQEWRHGPFLIRQGGSWRSSSAAAKGEVLGLSLPETGSGDMSTGRGVTMQFQLTTGD